jgi:hypothetical protein
MLIRIGCSVSGKTLTALAAATTIAVAAVATPTDAEAHWRGRGGGGAVAAGIIGGLALGAIASQAYRPYYGGYYGGPYYAAPAPVYYGPPCYWQRQRFWDGYGWRVQRVRVCY